MSKLRSIDSLVFGAVLLLLGTVILLYNFGIDIDFWSYVAKYWPMILIVYGLLKIARALQQRTNGNESA